PALTGVTTSSGTTTGNGSIVLRYSPVIVTVPSDPAPVLVSDVSGLFAAFNATSPADKSACGRTVQLTQSITTAGGLTASCGAQPVTLDLNGHDLTTLILSTSPASADGHVILTNSSTAEATVRSLVSLQSSDLRVGPRVAVVADSLAVDGGTRNSAIIMSGSGSLVVDGGTVTATSTDPLVPAIGGRLDGQGNSSQGTGSVVVKAGVLTASGTGQGRTAPVIGGASVSPSNSTRFTNGPVPVTVLGGTLTLDAGSAGAPAYGAGGGYGGLLSSVTARLVLGGTSGSPARVVVSQGTIPSVLLDGADLALPTSNELANGGALLPNPSGQVLIPEAIKVTGHHYRLAFPGDTSRLVAAKTFSAGGVTLPQGAYAIDGIDLTSTTDLSTLGGTPDAETGQVRLTASAAPRTVSTISDLRAALDPTEKGSACATGVRLGADFLQGMATLTNRCTGSFVLDLNGKNLTLQELKSVSGSQVTVRSSAAGGSMTVGSVDLSAGGTFVLGRGASLTANGRQSFAFNDNGPTITYLYPGVQFGATPATFRVDGGSATVRSSSDAGPAVGPFTFDGFANDARGSVQVQSGSLSVSKARGVAPLVGGDGYSQATIDLQVSGGTATLDAGGASGTVLDVSQGSTYFAAPLQVSGSADVPGHIEVVRGRIVLASKTTTGDIMQVRAHGTLELGASATLIDSSGVLGYLVSGGVIANAGTITMNPSKLATTKVTGNNYLLTFPAPQGQDPATRRVLAPTLAAAGATLPDGRWKIGSTKLTTTTDLSALTAAGTTDDATGLTSYAVVLGSTEVGSLAALEAALAGCTEPSTLTLSASISAPTTSLPVGCEVTLDLGGYDLTLAQLAVPDGTSVTVVDSGRETPGGPVKGLLTLDGAKATPAGAPFAIAPDGDDVGRVAGSVTIQAATAIGGAQVVPAGSTFEVGSAGVLSKVDGVAASISGGGLLANSGRIGSQIEIGDIGIEGTFTRVVFTLPSGLQVSQLVLGTSLASVGLEFPVIVGLAEDEYVRWGTAPGGGARVLGSTVLGGLEDDEDAVSLYPTIVRKGTELVSSLAELTAALAAAGGPGGSTTIKLAGSLSAPNAELVVPVSSAPAGVPVRLDLNGFDLSVDSIRVAPGALVVSDSSAVEPGDRPGVLSVTPGGARPGVALSAGGSFSVASGVVKVRAAAGQPGIGATGLASAGSVSVTGGVLEVVANLAEAGETAIGSSRGGSQAGSVSVTGGELRVRGFSTDHASLSIGASGRVVALSAAEAGQAGDVGAAIDGDDKVVNNGAIRGDLAGVTAPVAPHNTVVTFATAGGELPAGATATVRAYAGSLGAAGLATLPTPTRGLPGQWVFGGWKVVGDGPATDVATTSTLPGANDAGTVPGALTITAQWTPQSTQVTTLDALRTALAGGWPIVTVPAGTSLDLGSTTLDLGSARFVVSSGAAISGGVGATIIGAAGAVIENAGAIKVAVPVGTGATAYAGAFRGDAFTVIYSGLTGAAGTAQVLGASVSAVGASLPPAPVVPGKRFVGWSPVEQTATTTPEVIGGSTRLAAATTVDGALSGITLYPVYADRPEITSVASQAALIEALTCANGITAPVKVRITGALSLTEPVTTACTVELDLSGGSLQVADDLSLGADLSVVGGTLQLFGDLALGAHTLTIGATGAVSGAVLTSHLTRAEGGGIVNNGVLTWPMGLVSGTDTVPVRGLHFSVSFTVPDGVQAPTDRTVYAPTTGELPVPSRPGFSFVGWSTRSDGAGTLVTSTTALAELVGLSADGAPVAVALFPVWQVLPTGGAGPSSPPTSTPTADPTGTPTAEPTLPAGDSTLVVGPVGTGGSTGAPPQVGVPVSVDVTLPDVPGAAVGYQWQVVLEDGTVVDIEGATGSSFVPTGAYAGALLQVVITISAPGYAPNVQVVAFPRSAVVLPGVIEAFTVDRRVRGAVRGHPVVGRSVRAVLPRGIRRTLPEGATVAYRWSSGRKPLVRGGSERHLTVRRSMLARKLRLTVTVTAPGYETLTVKAPATRVVKARGYTGRRHR
ncbi:MAG: hypothetical protein F2667_00870, partial [Actinobacteria bacterium]|nr:hypothetical protein [Actinomycetota bacterium]